MRSENYTVTFGREAWTLEYKDESGTYIVTIDCDLETLESPNAKQRLILNPGVHRVSHDEGDLNPDESTATRIMRRVKVHLEHIGYEVQHYSQ